MPSKSPIYPLRLDPDRRARYEDAAEKAGMKLAPWIRDRLDRAAENLDDVTPTAARVSSAAVVHVPPPELEGKRFRGPDPKGGRGEPKGGRGR